MEEQFPGNSNKKKQTEAKKVEREPLEPIVTGEVIKKKKPIGRKFKNIFFGGDFSGAAKYVFSEVLLPSVRNLVVDAITKGAERAIYGEATARRRSSDPRSRYSYNNPLVRDPRNRVMLPDQPPHPPPRGRRYETGDIIIASKSEAESVIERLTDIIEKYDVASVADLYELLALPTNYVDNKWGWSNLSYVDLRQVREGWCLELPQVEPI